jgi:hypothetical protein
VLRSLRLDGVEEDRAGPAGVAGGQDGDGDGLAQPEPERGGGLHVGKGRHRLESSDRLVRSSEGGERGGAAEQDAGEVLVLAVAEVPREQLLGCVERVGGVASGDGDVRGVGERNAPRVDVGQPGGDLGDARRALQDRIEVAAQQVRSFRARWSAATGLPTPARLAMASRWGAARS